jgi:hypothetical protein
MALDIQHLPLLPPPPPPPPPETKLYCVGEGHPIAFLRYFHIRCWLHLANGTHTQMKNLYYRNPTRHKTRNLKAPTTPPFPLWSWQWGRGHTSLSHSVANTYSFTAHVTWVCMALHHTADRDDLLTMNNVTGRSRQLMGYFCTHGSWAGGW